MPSPVTTQLPQLPTRSQHKHLSEVLFLQTAVKETLPKHSKYYFPLKYRLPQRGLFWQTVFALAVTCCCFAHNL